MKSVSALWAIADPATAAAIERAHQAAAKDALAFIEAHALYTREGTGGVRQVDVTGLVAAAFTHRDSRAGDPDLHTHVAVANKVQTLDGRWLSIDGRVLYKANVSASETYNTALERRLHDDLGIRFAARPHADARKRPVREIVGMDPRLLQAWSSRRISIQARGAELARRFQHDHGRPPTPIESIQLAQQATLETRQAKHEPQSLADQRTAWACQARDVLGGTPQVRAMLRRVFSPTASHGERVDSAWIHQTTTRILDEVQARRSHWQSWHIRAETLRQIRDAELPADQIDSVITLLIDEVLTTLSVPLTGTGDGLVEPEQLTRADGSSMYTVAGQEMFTSARILAAEQRIVDRAGQLDGRTVPARVVDIALLEAAANGVTLNAGQAALVHDMATSGARVQLAIAPAGSGKTTAMRALAAAWADSGGTVLGLAPSATAATTLGEQLPAATTETLAKLTWSIDHDTLPDWARRVGPNTLVVVDEAGMADTLTLDRVVEYAVSRGASVRLVGDDQQLAAIGAGGVLRDIAATHGSTNLTELMRFADPAEGAATLALRDGLPEALGFYLDAGRVHVGDLATVSDDVFAAWQLDRSRGLDSVMLAPTRDQVCELNQRARAFRLAGELPAHTVRLADGNDASTGDVVITRANDRRLHLGGTDWVKNGDRWTILNLDATGGGISVQHARTGRLITLPADYVATSVDLGYASTIHTAQGLNTDTSHTLLTGQESRQLAYTAITRGRIANHLYVQVVGDGDPHSVIRPEAIHPLTSTDILETILARDDAPRSASTLLREQADPATLLGQATARYTDALTVAAEDTLGPSAVAALDARADRIVPDLSTSPAWPTLRAHLIMLGADGLDPSAELHTAATSRELDTADDPAAVLDWRLDDSTLRSAGHGPLPWLPGIPAAIAGHPTWGPYLAARATLVRDLADQVHQGAATAPAPAWASHGRARPTAQVLGDVAVWRAAMQVPDQDRRPTGATQLGQAAARWQHHLATQLAGQDTPALAEWSLLLDQVAPATRTDDFTPELAERLAAISRAGIDARAVLHRAQADGALPDDHAAAALWWRISRHLSPAVAARVDHDRALTSSWTPRLPDLVGDGRAAELEASPWWPTLVATVDHALARGCVLDDLLAGPPAEDDHDACQALVWRICVLTDPPPPAEDLDARPHLDDPPDDMWVDAPIPDDPHTIDAWTDDPTTHPAAARIEEDHMPRHTSSVALDDAEATAILTLAALARPYRGPLDPSDAEIERMVAWAHEADTAAVPPQRIAEINALALDYYTSRLTSGWAGDYLTGRLGHDLAGHPHIQPGYAPAAWTALVTHLRRHGVSDDEITASGLASTARTGRLIDRFRDRLILPIVHNRQILGFVARRHPDHADTGHAVPKYLNTPDTVLFHKGAQLYGANPDLMSSGATPVLVEGPLDALAVTLAGDGRYLGLATLGTSLTDAQARQLATLSTTPIIATDPDLAGRIAAHRDYWLLTQHGLDPSAARLPAGYDPADLLTHRGPERLKAALDAAQPLSRLILADHLDTFSGPAALGQAAAVVAAGHPGRWDDEIARIAGRLALPPIRFVRSLAAQVRAWDADPGAAVAAQLANLGELRARIRRASPAPRRRAMEPPRRAARPSPDPSE